MTGKTTLHTTWPRVKVSHASPGDGMTLCGKPVDPVTWDEGGFIDAEDDDGISCLRCQAVMRRIAKQETQG